ncbi:hypothetical protein [Falsiroseomonas selenitidurans]|uniref:Peptidase C39-like domain-containing protein n=1 Tax=Falsiroseomonas selenitidurans TaxID=2716335 RepID=A0ABX1E448_9PROT|nr:hypothetical protein [Falsiroseomonas selenitidurans]NKC31951.1 hypothetical protein [Falsiroseomonas selenitidurans]
MSYRTTPSMGQLHENSCWAACLAWWLKAVAGGRPSWTQREIIDIYWRSVDDNGAMQPQYLVTAWSRDKRLKMGTMVFKTPHATLDRLPIGPTPVCIAFKHLTGFAHMNVIWPNGPGRVIAMEPYFPFPGANGRRTGRFVDREIEHYNYGDAVILAYANPFAGESDTPG